MKLPLLLASASPRRAELLASAGVTFRVVPAAIPEAQVPAEGPEAAVLRLAREKAAHVARLHPDHLVLAADTLVAREGRILGKPRDQAEARSMLAWLSGAPHEVWTGVAFMAPGVSEAFATCTSVIFRPLSGAEIARYVESGEPMDKAGAYAIQGGAAGFVRSIHGSYTNVVGLPLAETLELLAALSPERN